MSADTVELRDATEELAAADGRENMNREDRSLVDLARLVQTRNGEVSVEE